MSDASVGSVGQRAGPEKQGLERLRNLIADFPDSDFRPAIRIAVKQLLGQTIEQLRGADFPLETPLRTLWLCHGRTFITARPERPSIDRFDIRVRKGGRAIARLVRKHVFRGAPDEDRISWFNEALFYHEIAPRIAVPGLVLPQLYGCQLSEDTVTLVLEYLEPHESHDDLQDSISRKAWSVGGLGAAAHREKLHTVDWIVPAVPQMKETTLSALESLAAHCIPDAVEQARIVGALENLIGSPDVVAHAKNQGYRCLAHGDLHRRNLFSMTGTAGDMAVIDWGNVCEGLIGQDAVLLLLPRFFASPEWENMDFAQAVELVQQAVVAGAQSIDAALDPSRIRLGLEIELVFQTAIVATRHAAKWTALNAQGPQRKHLQRNAQMLRHVADVAEALFRQHSS